MTVADLHSGQTAIIKNIDFSHPSSCRVVEYGFTPGQELQVINKSIFNDPLSVSLRGALIAIRKQDARCIEVFLPNEH
ncbi:MAG: ferrous iron transport protein A [Bacteroidetes bacterium]|nr:ferrous iron transport protein A [Bacteroidota bacterium]